MLNMFLHAVKMRRGHSCNGTCLRVNSSENIQTHFTIHVDQFVVDVKKVGL